MKNEKITDPRSPTYAPVKGDGKNGQGAGGQNPAPLEFPNEEKTPANIPERS